MFLKQPVVFTGTDLTNNDDPFQERIPEKSYQLYTDNSLTDS